jgi:hypothetical protein
MLEEYAGALLHTLERWGWEREDAGAWTGKDHLAHIVTWQRRLLHWFAEDVVGRTPHRPEPGFSFEQTDALNERDWLASRGRPLEDIRREFEDEHRAVVRLVEGMSEEDLTREDRYPWLGYAALDAIAGNSFGHYLEHAEMLRE